MVDLGDPLLLDIVERVGRVDREADQDDVRVRVRQGSQAVIVFLPRGIPQRELDPLSVHLDVRDTVGDGGGGGDPSEGGIDGGGSGSRAASNVRGATSKASCRRWNRVSSTARSFG